MQRMNANNKSQSYNYNHVNKYSLEKLVQSNEGVYRNARYMNISLILMGCPVTLKVKSGDIFHGIFATFSSEFEVVLECCHKIDNKNEIVIYGRSLPSKNEVKTVIFKKEDIVEIIASDIDKDFAIKTAENNFIDAAIAQKNHFNGHFKELDCKELIPFECNDLETHKLDLDIENMDGWSADDMLMTNETKYGYKSTYKSDLPEYTIAVEREDTEEYRLREEVAEKLAFEIESCSTYKNNVDKELSDNEEEENVFSAVERSDQMNENAISNNNNIDLNTNNNNNNSIKDSSPHQSSFKLSNNEKYSNQNKRIQDQRIKQRFNNNNINNSSNSSINNFSTSNNNIKRYISNSNNNNNNNTNNNNGQQNNIKNRNSSTNLMNRRNNTNESTSITTSNNINNKLSNNDLKDLNMQKRNQKSNNNNQYNQTYSSVTHNKIMGNISYSKVASANINQQTNNETSIYQENTTSELNQLENKQNDKVSRDTDSSSPKQLNVNNQQQIEDACNLNNDNNNNEIQQNHKKSDIDSNSENVVLPPLSSSISITIQNNNNNNNNNNNPNIENNNNTNCNITTTTTTNNNNNNNDNSNNNNINNSDNDNNSANNSNCSESSQTLNTSTKSNDVSKSKLNPFAEEFNPGRSQMTSPLNTSQYVHQNPALVTHITSQQHATQMYFNNGPNGSYYIVNPIPPPPPPPLGPNYTQGNMATGKQMKKAIFSINDNNSTAAITISNHHNPPLTVPIPASTTVPNMNPQIMTTQTTQQLGGSQSQNQRNQSSNGTFGGTYVGPPLGTQINAFQPINFPQQQSQQANVPQLAYGSQQQIAFQNTVNSTNSQIRMYSQNGQYIAYPQNDTTQMYSQNSSVIYNPMIQNQQHPQIAQQNNIIYAPTSSTPTALVSAPHTPSPMPQQQQQQAQPSQTSQATGTNIQNNVNQTQIQSQQQIYPPTVYYIPSSPNANMQPAMAPYPFVPYNSNPPNSQQYMIVNQPVHVHSQQQVQNRMYCYPNTNTSYSHPA